MTFASLLPGAAPRVLREAVGRRALQLALLVGGLVALGFLCGGRAQAAEEAPAVPAAVTSQVSTSTSVPHTERAVRPVRVAVTAAMTAVKEQVDRASEQASSAPSAPDLPHLPGVEDPADLGGLTDLSGLPSLPVRTLPVPTPSLPGTQEPRPGAPVTSSPHGHGSAGRKAADGVTAPSTASYGPLVSVTGIGGAAGVRMASPDPVHAHSGGVPANQGPSGDPSGVLGGVSVLDGGASRHGDAHAVTSGQGVPLRLVPGGAVRSYAAEIQDRYRDVPVFPG
ncbi:hypothetical protein ACIBVL_18035 [Streptomyces sp. NPDC049687]|uniref:hypothetical protein n=1 Tax=Streptomyces sp. NPDC049687 TaxID=3365596 RepID=UPI0037973B74